eukprot:TRINITY_DN8770_c0_g1_i9.p1 TRINITY_DN8770_c0_g1~~TRINITY_DN8770_c0_g1_i9.p1  ORF type:complete len:573 (-),score=46.12 TRINITY_DN8770_c0_g1_i9:167-1885(-)
MSNDNQNQVEKENDKQQIPKVKQMKEEGRIFSNYLNIPRRKRSNSFKRQRQEMEDDQCMSYDTVNNCSDEDIISEMEAANILINVLPLNPIGSNFMTIDDNIITKKLNFNSNNYNRRGRKKSSGKTEHNGVSYQKGSNTITFSADFIRKLFTQENTARELVDYIRTCAMGQVSNKQNGTNALPKNIMENPPGFKKVRRMYQSNQRKCKIVKDRKFVKPRQLQPKTQEEVFQNFISQPLARRYLCHEYYSCLTDRIYCEQNNEFIEQIRLGGGYGQGQNCRQGYGNGLASRTQQKLWASFAKRRLFSYNFIACEKESQRNFRQQVDQNVLTNFRFQQTAVFSVGDRVLAQHPEKEDLFQGVILAILDKKHYAVQFEHVELGFSQLSPSQIMPLDVVISLPLGYGTSQSIQYKDQSPQSISSWPKQNKGIHVKHPNGSTAKFESPLNDSLSMASRSCTKPQVAPLSMQDLLIQQIMTETELYMQQELSDILQSVPNECRELAQLRQSAIEQIRGLCGLFVGALKMLGLGSNKKQFFYVLDNLKSQVDINCRDGQANANRLWIYLDQLFLQFQGR